jgi:hypothetical protein
VFTAWFTPRIFPRRFIGTLKTHHQTYTSDEALEILYPHTNDTPEIEKMVRKLYRIKRGENVTIDKEQLQRILQNVT